MTELYKAETINSPSSSRFLLAHFLHLGGTENCPEAVFLRQYAQGHGGDYVCFGWPEVKTDARKVEGMSIVGFMERSLAGFREAVREFTGPIILVGSSVATTVTFKAIEAARDVSAHVVAAVFISVGYDVKKHMIEPITNIAGDEWLSNPPPEGLKHPLHVPESQRSVKFTFLHVEDLRQSLRWQIFDSGRLFEDSPPIYMFSGSRDTQTPAADAENLSCLIRIRSGEIITQPLHTIIEGAGHLFSENELNLVGRVLDPVFKGIALG